MSGFRVAEDSKASDRVLEFGPRSIATDGAVVASRARGTAERVQPVPGTNPKAQHPQPHDSDEAPTSKERGTRRVDVGRARVAHRGWLPEERWRARPRFPRLRRQRAAGVAA